MATDFRKLKAIEWQNKKRIKNLCPEMQDRSRIYIFYRTDEESNVIARYIGKSETSILQRCAGHLNGHDQHIDKSLILHKLYSEDNPTGWRVDVLEYCKPQECNERERFYIEFCTKYGVALHNVESGGTAGKTDINQRKEMKGYKKGVQYGYEKARKEIRHLFALHLKTRIKSDKPNKIQEKALQKFIDFLNGGQ